MKVLIIVFLCGIFNLSFKHLSTLTLLYYLIYIQVLLSIKMINLLFSKFKRSFLLYVTKFVVSFNFNRLKKTI